MFALYRFDQCLFNCGLPAFILIFVFDENEIVLEMLVGVRESDGLSELECIDGTVA